jgi:hypothetical protein
MRGVSRGFWVLLLVGVGAAGWGLWELYGKPNQTDLTAYWQLVVAVAALAVAVIPLLRDLRTMPGDDAGSELDELTDRLADAVTQQWIQAATARRLLQPEPIAVRWTLPADPVAGSAAAAAASTRFPPLPGFGAIPHELREGGVRDLHTVYAGLGSGRMMIVGGPGSGKSGAAVLLVLAALRHRNTVGDRDRTNVPVPVLFTPHGWNPRSQPVREWLVVQLRQTYEGLFPGRRGARAAERLLDEGRITVVLDGLDEMTEQLRPLALQALSEQAAFRLVVLARTTETAEAAEQAMLDEAFAVELEGVDPAAAADYLTRVQLDPPPDRWRELTDLLRNAPDDPLARALQNPLTLTLVRDTYRRGDSVGELLDLSTAAQGSISREDVEDHLLDRVLPQAYTPRPGHAPPRYPLTTAQRTLGLIAARMSQDQTRDLAWWRIPGWSPRFPRALAIGLVSGFVVSVGLNYLLFGGMPRDTAGLILASVVLGGMLGAWLGGRAQAHAEPARWRLMFSHPALVFVLAVVSAQVFLWVCQSWLATSFWIDLLVWLTISFGVGLTAWLAIECALWLAEKNGHRTMRMRWRSVRRHQSTVFVIGFAFGVLAFFVNGSLLGRPGLLLGVGLVALLMLGLGLWGGLGRPGMQAVAPLTPIASWGQYRAAALTAWLGLGLATGGFIPLFAVGIALMFRIHTSPLLVLPTFLGIGLISGFILGRIYPETWSTSLACVQLATRRGIPMRLMQFLDDAHERNVLRTVGPVYQFRHARLQDRLARVTAPVGPGESESDRGIEDQVDEFAGGR